MQPEKKGINDEDSIFYRYVSDERLTLFATAHSQPKVHRGLVHLGENSLFKETNKHGKFDAERKKQLFNIIEYLYVLYYSTVYPD